MPLGAGGAAGTRLAVMADSCTSTALIDALRRFSQERERMRSALARTLGVATADLEALTHLQSDGALTQREIGSRLMLTSGAVTTLVDRLARAGWVQRRPNPDDRRSVLVELTPEGAAELHPALAEFDCSMSRAADAMSDEDRRHATHLLTAVTQAATRAVDALGGPPGESPAQGERRATLASR